MRQPGLAAPFGVIGTILAAFIVRFVAEGTRSISDGWLTAGAVLPVLGVVLGAAASHRLSAGAPTPGR